MNEIEEIKRRVSPKLLQTKGVSGVGIQSGALTVYLAEDSDDVRRDVAALLEAEEPGTPVKFLVTGTFRAQ
jgi:hypothetical protein